MCTGARQAAELLLVLDDDVLVELVDVEEPLEVDDVEDDVEVVDFAAGLLLDDEPRLSFR